MTDSEHDHDAIKRAKALIAEAERLPGMSINTSNTAAKLIGEDYLALHERWQAAVDALAVLYRANPAEVARVCDEEADTTGRLLGVVRAAAKREQ